jgi:broad specificity phosphatase PhoE
LRSLLECDSKTPAELGYVSSPLARARTTMEIVRATLDLAPSDFPVDERLVEIAFGDWEGLTYPDVLKRDKDVVAQRESNKWGFTPPGGESYAQVTARISAWYATVEKDTLVAAHGGTARALVAHLAIAQPEDATHYSIDQGVVYVFAGNRLAKYA